MILTAEQQRDLLGKIVPIKATDRTILSVEIIHFLLKNKAIEIVENDIQGTVVYNPKLVSLASQKQLNNGTKVVVYNPKLVSLASRCIYNQSEISKSALEVFISLLSNSAKLDFDTINAWTEEDWTTNINSKIDTIVGILAGISHTDNIE
jgi:hypothetical protein